MYLYYTSIYMSKYASRGCIHYSYIYIILLESNLYLYYTSRLHYLWNSRLFIYTAMLQFWSHMYSPLSSHALEIALARMQGMPIELRFCPCLSALQGGEWAISIYSLYQVVDPLSTKISIVWSTYLKKSLYPFLLTTCNFE